MMNGGGMGTQSNGGILSSNDRYASGGYAPAPTSGGTPIKTTTTTVGLGAPVVMPGHGAAEAGMMGGEMGGSGMRAKSVIFVYCLPPCLDINTVFWRIRALYAYNASPDDANEVSFNKGEILEITDASGKWWQCKTSAGHSGSKSKAYDVSLNIRGLLMANLSSRSFELLAIALATLMRSRITSI
jgi:SHO1 osmosensor